MILLLLSVALISCADDENGTNRLNGRNSYNVVSKYLLNQLINEYSTVKNESLAVDDLRTLIDQIKQFVHKLDEDDSEDKGHTIDHEDKFQHVSCENFLMENFSDNTNRTNYCLQTQCLSAEEIFQLHSVPQDGFASSDQLQEMSSTILYQLQNPNCFKSVQQVSTNAPAPNAAEVWGYGFLCVTLINLCSLMGLFFMPLMRRSFYHLLLMFMVALAVGTLAGSSLLFLIPEAFDLKHEGHISESYIWKSTIIMAGIYMFFLTERIIKLVMTYRLSPKEQEETLDKIEHDENLAISSVKLREVHREESMNMSFKPPPESSTYLSEQDAKAGLMQANGAHNVAVPDVKVANGHKTLPGHGHSHHHQPIKTVAWMVIVGDGLHNFIDGLSIGAAFAQSTLSGISISLAVICEELPHELGDFAILLNSGMSMKKALLFNFLSACMCYFGLTFGILVGEFTGGSQWIFALAGGMFLYISLVDMLPEVNAAAEEDVRNGKDVKLSLKIFFIQNCGLLTGYAIMIILAFFGDHIDLESQH